MEVTDRYNEVQVEKKKKKKKVWSIDKYRSELEGIRHSKLTEV